jgi:8-oxo-dGTP pyrophosphatase MutT (NUDIX family)
MDVTILTQKELFLERVIDKLGRIPLDYVEKLSSISGTGYEGWRAAGVLVLLYYKPEESSAQGSGEFYFQLIKRSAVVPQPGDLSCPGGTMHPMVDRIISSLTAHPMLPFMKGTARKYTKEKGRDVLRATSLFLTTALRESWEEVRLSPLNVGFLGALPSSDLLEFRMSIFPVVGLVKRPWSCRPNWEVDKILEIPLRAFCRSESYGTMKLETLIPLRTSVERIRTLSCFLVEDGQGKSEVLWGKTLDILLQFFRIVFDYEPATFETGKVIKKSLSENYITGKTTR